MERIALFLEKFKSLGLETSVAKKLFIDEVKATLHFDLDSKDVVLKDGTIFVKSHPVLKSELFIKKNLFLERLSKTLGPTKISNLR